MTKTVMIVDDDPDIRDAFSSILEIEGYEVVCAEHGQAALDYLSSNDQRPCMIFLDLMMPVMDGWEFRDRQRQLPQHADIPVIVVTAAGRDRGTGIDAARILQKPIGYEQIMEAIQTYC
jgi:CheY-like chemotaxis protein